MGGGFKESLLGTKSLFLLGQDDDVITPDLICGYENNVNDSQVEFIENADHFILDHQPEIVTRRVDEFLHT